MMFYNVEAAVFQRTLGRTRGCEAKSRAPGAPPPRNCFVFLGGEKKSAFANEHEKNNNNSVDGDQTVSADLKSSADMSTRFTLEIIISL